MLVSLRVKNLALIEEAEVYFGDGLNILSGETGAGKSILMGSVNMALGGKVSRELIRAGAEYAYAELVFDASEEAVKKLSAMDLYPEEGNQYVFSRKLLLSGRSICRINGEACTAALQKQAGEYLLDIHGQQEHQTLVQGSRQLEIVDAYAGERAKEVRRKVKELYEAYRLAKKELEEASMDEQQRAREMSFARFETEEIEAAGLMEGEDEELEERYRKMVNSRKITEAVSQVYEQTGYDSMHGAGDAIGRAVHALSGVLAYDRELEGLNEQLSTIDSLLNDFNRELQDYGKRMEFSEADFQELEERLNVINRLKDKYGSTIGQILNYREEKLAYLNRLESYGAYVEELKQKVSVTEGELAKACAALGAVRREEAGKLSAKISDALKELNFLEVVFDIVFLPLEHFTAGGTDEVQFMISANPGEPVKPLKQVSSGGELSRIMLAVKAALADRDEVGTQIFDEIDAGISGRTAQKVSEKLNVISEKRQVICITHLPQIASMADRHFLIEKQAGKGSTHTVITQLSREEEIRELARMLGGVKITDAVLQNAREMKELAERTKNKKAGKRQQKVQK